MTDPLIQLVMYPLAPVALAVGVLVTLRVAFWVVETLARFKCDS